MEETNNYYIHQAYIVNENKIFQGDVLVQQGKIARIMGSKAHVEELSMLPDTRYIDATGLYLFPGGIDEHVHFRDPGLTHKGDFSSESRAAIAGGVCSVLDMPNTVPQTISKALWEAKQASAAGKMHCNYGFYVGATNHNIEEIKSLDIQQVAGIKLFLGSSTGDMLLSDESVLEKIFQWQRMPLLAHCESETIIQQNTAKARQLYGEVAPFRIHPEIRSATACYESSRRAVDLAKKNHAPLHILHVSTKEELQLLDEQYPTITMETCPSYLMFSEEDYDRLGCRIKCNPSIKTVSDQTALIQALQDGRILSIGSDHAPHTWEEKQRDYFHSPSGMPMVGHSLLILLELCHRQQLKLTRVAALFSHQPADLLQIANKGYIREHYDADIVLVDLNQTTTISRDNCHYRCHWTPLEGDTLHGRIVSTFVNGHRVYHEGSFCNKTYGTPLHFNR